MQELKGEIRPLEPIVMQATVPYGQSDPCHEGGFGVCRDLDQGKHIHTKWVQNLLTFGTGYIFKELKESDMTHSGMKNGHQNDNCPL